MTARNREQNFALNLLMDPECDFVTLTGTAGTGKTLMALAAGLSAGAGRPPLHRDHRHPRHGAAWARTSASCPAPRKKRWARGWARSTTTSRCWRKTDSGAGEWGRAATNDLVRSKIKIKSMNFMRGRTFLNKYVIIDEAQNLTPKQMKTLITRAGPGTKIVCLGNLAQIDTPYLTEGSSGLTFAVDRFKGWPHSGPRHAGARRALAAGRLRQRSAVAAAAKWRSVAAALQVLEERRGLLSRPRKRAHQFARAAPAQPLARMVRR